MSLYTVQVRSFHRFIISSYTSQNFPRTFLADSFGAARNARHFLFQLFTTLQLSYLTAAVVRAFSLRSRQYHGYVESHTNYVVDTFLFAIHTSGTIRRSIICCEDSPIPAAGAGAGAGAGAASYEDSHPGQAMELVFVRRRLTRQSICDKEGRRPRTNCEGDGCMLQDPPVCASKHID